MKGNFDVLIMVLLVVTGIAIFVMFGPTLGTISIILIEGVIVAAIVILLMRYFRSRK